MNNYAFETYLNLYPKDRLDEIRRFFAKLSIVKKIDVKNLQLDLRKTIAALSGVETRQLLKLIGDDYCHIIQEDRPDFAFALITTAFIIGNPQVFFTNPMPFLFKSYNDGLTDTQIKKTAIEWIHRSDKDKIMKHAETFFSETPKTSLYLETIFFLIDEMVSNSSHSDSSTDKKHLFFAYSTDRILVGSKDNNICSMAPVRQRIKDVSRNENLQVRAGSGSAGLGIPMMIQNCTNFYFICSKVRGTLTCSLIDVRRGLRDLEEIPKNIHFFEVNS